MIACALTHSTRSPLKCVRNRLDAIAQEMQDALVRSAYSNIIKEGHDCSAALFDAARRGDRSGDRLAGAARRAADRGKAAWCRCSAESSSSGDVFAFNDPYDGGTHLPDICLVAPMMRDGAVIAYAACIAHHQDIGGKTPGSLPTDSTDIFQEGLRIPPIKLYEAGKPNAVAHAFIERNVRLPHIILVICGRSLPLCMSAAPASRALIDEHGADG